MEEKKYDLFRPWLTLDPWQKEFIECVEHDCWALTGRQVGKTTAVAIKIVECAIGKETAYTGKGEYMVSGFTEDQGGNVFLKVLMYLQARYPHMIDMSPKKKPNAHNVYLKNGSHIFLEPLGLMGMGARGKTLKRLCIDEAQLCLRDVFVALIPSMAVSGGKLDMTGTPAGKQGYFYECSDEPELVAADKVMPNFKRWRVSAEDCPRHSQAELDKAKKMLSKREYAQEYLAQFLDDVQRVFSDEWIKKVCCLDKTQVQSYGGKSYLGVDIARLGEDLIAFASIERISRERFVQNYLEIAQKKLTTWTEQRIIDLHNGFKFSKIAIDAGSGSLGVGVYDHLINEPKMVDKVIAINNREIVSRIDESKGKFKLMKEDLYMNLLRMGEKGELKLYNDDDVILSLMSVQWENVIATGRITKTRIFGRNTHVAEALTRSSWEAKHDNSLNLFAI